MKKQHLYRLSAILLFLSMILGIMPRNAFLANAAAADQTEQLVLRAEDVPEYFTLADMQNAGHVKRADRNGADHLNEIEFQNRDGTNTVYAFNENVRYVTANGEYKDKSNRLERGSDGSYSNPQNDIRVNYPAKLAQGVTVTRGDFSLTLVPEYTNNSPVAQPTGKEQSVYYPKAFGSNTVLQYTQTFNGFKEDIILASAPESNQFRFTLTTNGATLSMDGDRLLVTVDGKEVGCFEPIYIYDSAGNSCYGSMQLLTSSARNTYSLIITAPWDFLTDADTVYPVSVDPTLTLDNRDTVVIQDANVFTNYNQNYGSNVTMSIGDYSQHPGDEPRGIGYGLVKFPYLTANTALVSNFNANRLTELKYFFTVTDCVMTTPLQARRINVTWSEYSVTYSNVSSYISGIGTTSTPTISASSSSKEYSINLLSLIDSTTNYNNMATKGLVLSTVPTDLPALTIRTAETTSYRPYLKYTYISYSAPQTTGITDGTTYMLVNTMSGKALNGASLSSQISASTPYATSLFTVEFCHANNTANGYYQIKRFNTDLLLTGTSAGLSLAAYNGTDTQMWHITPTNNGSYQIQNAGLEGKLITTNGSTQSVSFGLSETGSEWRLVPYVLAVPLFEQRTTYTCGQACARMILSSFNISVSEATLLTKCEAYGISERSKAGTIAAVMKTYTQNLGIDYQAEYIGNSYQYFETLLKDNIDNGYPVMFNIVVSSVGEFFNYTTGGHYVTVAGYYYDQSQQRYMLVVKDPHYNDDDYGIVYCLTRHVPLTYLYNCYVAGNAQYIVVVNGLS